MTNSRKANDKPTTEWLSFFDFVGINGQVHLMTSSFKTVSLLLPVASERYAIIIIIILSFPLKN